MSAYLAYGGALLGLVGKPSILLDSNLYTTQDIRQRILFYDEYEEIHTGLIFTP